jgi:23S rRNA U2552 (ribose-2'-O)-methylase RlmE/FtsJ
MRTQFKSVATRKPEASRGRSSELYLLGKGHAGGTGSDG